MTEVRIPLMHEPRPATDPGGRIRVTLVVVVVVVAVAVVAVVLAGLAGAALATRQSSGHGLPGDDHAVRDRGEWRAMLDEADDSTRRLERMGSRGRAVDTHAECVLIIEESLAFERAGSFATLPVTAYVTGVRQP